MLHYRHGVCVSGVCVGLCVCIAPIIEYTIIWQINPLMKLTNDNSLAPSRKIPSEITQMLQMGEETMNNEYRNEWIT